MSGVQIKHPRSTNFHDDDAEEQAASKRPKPTSIDSLLTKNTSNGSDSPPRSHDTSHAAVREIPDSDAEDDDDDTSILPLDSNRKTDLESALPSIKTDKQAIKDYEASRAAESSADDIGVSGRLSQRKWVPGKSSIYVDAFNLALETVLDEESHLFDEAEHAVFAHWRALSYEGQYLYVRLFLRKTAAWHRVNRLGYYGDIADLPTAVEDLLKSRPLPEVETALINTPGEEQVPQDTVLGSELYFAESSDDHIETLEEASSLLLLDELKTVAKDAKVQGKNKSELLKSFRKTSNSQSGLGWRGMRRSDTEESIRSEKSVEGEDNDTLSVTDDNLDHRAVNRDDHFVKKILASTGQCIRLSRSCLTLFERVHLVFYRSTEWTEKSLTTIILARISRRNFPTYIVSRSANIFTSREDLLEFEASIRTQFRVDSILEYNGTVRREGLMQVKAIFDAVYPRWRSILQEEQLKADRMYESGEGAYLRRFSPAWVYTRIVHKGTYVLGRFKEHLQEYQLLCELLDQRLFHGARRGSWYQRKALLEEHYMSALIPAKTPFPDEESAKKHWKRIALRTCEAGLEDSECHLIYHYDLQKRIQKLEKSLKLPKREHHDFGHVRLAKPLERTVYGIRVERARPSSRTGSRRESADGSLLMSSDSPLPSGSAAATTPRRGAKTIWIDEREGGGLCSVEAMCLSHYRDLGWKGYHSEGGIVRTLFGYLFYDVLFTYVPNVFQTEYQTCPLDLHTDAFYPSRASEINHRLVEIENGHAERLLRQVYEAEVEKQTCIVGVHWDYEFDDLLEIVQCFDGSALATLCKVMAQEYQQRGGGIPDLFLWKLSSEADPRGQTDVGSNGANGTSITQGQATKYVKDNDKPNDRQTHMQDPKHPRKGQVMFAEVKSENDRLSDTQRLWIHVLTGAGIPVELCAAVAREVREE